MKKKTWINKLKTRGNLPRLLRVYNQWRYSPIKVVRAQWRSFASISQFRLIKNSAFKLSFDSNKVYHEDLHALYYKLDE